MADPMHQFEIQQVLELPAVAGFDLSITNSALWMIIAAASVTLFFAAASAKAAVVPGRLQSVGEMLYELIHNLTDSIIGHEGKKYFPFVFTLFAFILAMNLLGMVPYFFEVDASAFLSDRGDLTAILHLLRIPESEWVG